VATINLGRNCTISVGGSVLTSVRNVTVTGTRVEIECPLLYGGETHIFPGNKSWTVEVEFIGNEDASALTGEFSAKDVPVQVSSTHFSGTCYVVGLTSSEPLDDVVIYTATLKKGI
jgi:hypothetical protein